MSSHVLCSISIAHPLPLFFFPIVLGIVIVCNAKGQPKERGGYDCPRSLKNSPGQPHCKECLWIIVPLALPPMVPPATARTKKKKRRKVTTLAASVAASNDALAATPMPSTPPTTKKGRTTSKKKAAEPINLCMTPMWAKTNNVASHRVAHEQLWVVGSATTIKDDGADKPLSGCQWYRKGQSGKRIARSNPDFAHLLAIEAILHIMPPEQLVLMLELTNKRLAQPSMGAVQ